ncbi:MAG: DUF192 domain-containing protein [Candidatus Eremiobacteraeota bacterium]|nr:DUF192 domain-containing protein [Candidatus Eremiobacteraeota bacterium]
MCNLAAVVLAATLPTVVLQTPRATLTLEVASTAAQREHGLMNRSNLPAHSGMIFIFRDDAPVEFWMKNTLVPLDMLFVAPDGMVRSVAPNVPVVDPKTPDQSIPRVDGRAKYVIELPAGEAARDGIVSGTRLHLPALPAAAP